MSNTETKERYHFRQLGGRLETLRERDVLPAFSQEGIMATNSEGGFAQQAKETPADKATHPGFYFSEEDYKKIVQESYDSGFQKGYEQGKIETSSFYERQQHEKMKIFDEAFAGIAAKLSETQHSLNDIAQKQLASLVPLTLTIAQKLSGLLMEGKEHEKLCQEIKKCLQFVADEPTIKLGVSAEIFSAMQDIQSMLGKTDAVIESIYADGQLAPSEFRLEWEGGKIETHYAKIDEAIHHLLSSVANNHLSNVSG
ncbi:MAG: hypothetical protein IPP74_06440 [Alphaproteobacteria bacterium]|nr:hypothetical protein [Alphaproteobacteria bacterium]